MKRFDKNKQLRKLHNRKNNSNMKIISIVLSITILVGAIIYFTFARFESSTSYNLISGTATFKKEVMYTKMINLESAGTSDLQYDTTADNNLRYVGTNPNNYIYFNCSTQVVSEMNDETCEKWRIIGYMKKLLFPYAPSVTGIKIIRAEPLGKHNWDLDNSVNNGYGINAWGNWGGYEGADLMLQLNNYYLNNGQSDNRWYTEDNVIITERPEFKLINENAKTFLQTIRWNTTPINYAENSTYNVDYLTLNAPNVYLKERLRVTNNAWCYTSTDCNDGVVRKEYAEGIIGLINPSDYLYATGGGSQINRDACLNASLSEWRSSAYEDCVNNNWMNFHKRMWTITAYSGTGGVVTSVELSGAVTTFPASYTNVVYPTAILKSGTRVISGDGSESKPYKIEI